MRQRLLIARALLPRPRVLLLDEPTRSLDPLVARDLRRFLKERLVMAEGCTILLATHSGDEAMALCDRVAILDKGKVLAVGTPAAIARTVGDQRFTLWTRTPEHPMLASLEARGFVRDVALRDKDEEGWTSVQLSIPGNTAAAARVLDLLQSAGIEVARFERTQLALADLIERVMARSEEHAS
jgi:ABC-type multidrug transport system ATPase subunit